MNRIALIALFICIAILLSIGSGYWSQISNPNGIWLYTPPADGSGKPIDAFNFGVTLELYLISISYLAIGIGLYAWAKLKHSTLLGITIPIAMSAPIVFMLAVIFSWQSK